MLKIVNIQFLYSIFSLYRPCHCANSSLLCACVGFICFSPVLSLTGCTIIHLEIISWSFSLLKQFHCNGNMIIVAQPIQKQPSCDNESICSVADVLLSDNGFPIPLCASFQSLFSFPLLVLIESLIWML